MIREVVSGGYTMILVGANHKQNNKSPRQDQLDLFFGGNINIESIYYKYERKA